MKFASYEIAGQASYGLVRDGQLTTVKGALKDRFGTLRAAIAADGLEEIAAALQAEAPDAALADVSFLPTIPDPEKILCVGLNYKAHIDETGNRDRDYPTIFTRFANCQVGHLRPMIKPRESDRLDYEGELAVIVGRGGRRIAEADALHHVAGYACYNEGSVRDFQRHTSQFTPGKNFMGTGAFGPWMVTSDQIPDPARLTLETRLNGQVMQHATTDLLVFSIPYLIAYISTFTELAPGDVIVSGTPGGVGSRRDPPVYMTHGDRVEVEISGIGVLTNPVVAET
jgi:2-keto-4-pentenoate hydratase/2-oxohepta-3-ene-1,7-dioic acid hydratase in catechol pathway